MNEIDPAQLRDNCIVDAEHGLRDSETLAASGSYGRARSLDLLAYETVVRAMACHLVTLGWATFDSSKRTDAFYISPKALENHPLKQLLIVFVEPAVRGLAEVVAWRARRGEPPVIGPEVVTIEMIREDSDPPLPLPSLNPFKNEGLYPSRDGRVPSDVTEQEYRLIHDRVVRRVRLVKALIRTPLPPAFAESQRELWGRLAREGHALDEKTLSRVKQIEKATSKPIAEIMQGEFGAAQNPDTVDRP